MSFTYITEENLGVLLEEIRNATQVMGADIESTGLNFLLNKILLFQLNVNNKVFVCDARAMGKTLLAKILMEINRKGTTVVLHNAKFDMKFLYRDTGIMLENVADTMIMESLLNAGRGKVLYSLEELAEKYTGTFMDKEVTSQFIDFPDDKPFTQQMLLYSALDVKVLPEIYEKQLDLAMKAHEINVANLEMSLIPVVAEMEYRGICIDTQRWLQIEEEAKKKLEELSIEFKRFVLGEVLKKTFKNGLELAVACAIPVKTKKLTAALEGLTDVGNMSQWLTQNVNLGSPLQMKKILNLLGIEVDNTNEKTLADFKGNEAIDRLLEIREISKQVTTYGSKFLEVVNPVSRKVHTEYFQTGTATGRFSSSRPNMQNIPTHGGYRECFIPEKGYKFISIDYSQQEYRLAGAVSKDKRIIDAYKHGSDMHTATASVAFQKPMDKVTKEERNMGKTINFAILYGSTEFGLKRNLKIPVEEAKQIIENFWNGYPDLSSFMKMAGEYILKFGFSSTPLGRRRYNIEKPLFADSREYTKWMERVLREGRNHIIQGGGADIIKLAMVRIRKENPYGSYLRILLQVHDELLVEVREDLAEEALVFVKKVMEEEEQRFLGEIPAKTEEAIKERWTK